MDLKAGLYIVSTPIGNLQDITFRAILVLTNCDTIYCEDTRFTKKLLEKHQIYGKKLAIYNDHSSLETRVTIAEQIKLGAKIALVSDAGTPLIADPGYKLVNFLYDEGLKVDIIPGPCAVISALIISGLPTDQFYFTGFIPKTVPSRIKLFSSLKTIPATLVFYDTIHRIVDSLKIALEVFGNRKATIVRELTKIYQTVYCLSLKDLIKEIEYMPLKGEIILLISGKGNQDKPSIEEIIAEAQNLSLQLTSSRDAVESIVAKYPDTITKKALYRLLHSKNLIS